MLSRMRASIAAASLFVVALAGCGGNSTGVDTGGTGIEPSSGSSSGNGSATGNGSTDPTNAGSVGANGGTTTTSGYVPQACNQTTPCPSGQVCSTQSTDRGAYGEGYCVLPCTLPSGIDVGKASCPGSSFCVRAPQSDYGACVLPCGVDTDCPALPGLEAACVTVVEGGPRFCIWGPQATPGGGGSTP